MRTFVLVDDKRRRLACEAIWQSPLGWLVQLGEPGKTNPQARRYHAMIGDIARQWEFIGRYWDAEDCKRILVDAFAAAMREHGTPLRHSGLVIPSIDRQRVVQLGVQTRRFSVKEASDFIEHLFAFGAEHDLEWSDLAQPGKEPRP